MHSELTRIIIMIKIAEHRIQKYGARGYAISFPTVFVKDNELKHKDYISIYRETLKDGTDALIIIPLIPNGKNNTEQTSKSQES